MGEQLKWFVFTMMFISLWAFFYAFQIASLDLPGILFWIKLKYLGISFAPSTWLLFCIKYSGRHTWLTKKFLIFIFTFPLLTYLFVLTNESHFLYYSMIKVVKEGPFTFAEVQKGPWYFIHTLYFYAALLLGNYVLISSYKDTEFAFRKHVKFLVISTIFPWLLNIAYMLGFKPYGHLDLTPFAFILSSGVIAIGLVKYNLFDLIPIAKDKLISAMTDGVLVIDGNNKILHINPAMKNIIDPKIKNHIGLPVTQLFRRQETLMEMIRKRLPGRIEISTTIDQGQYSVEAVPLYEQQSKYIGLLLLFKDITEAKKNQDLLRMQSDELKHHNELKDKLFSIISHDLKGPILGVKEIVDMAKKGMMSEEDIMEILPELSKSVDGVTMLMENLLAWSRSQLKGEFIQKDTFDIVKLIQQQKNLMGQIAASKDIRLEVQENQPVMVSADINMIELVLRNLLNNSIKFCSKGDKVWLGVKSGKDEVRIYVRDTGIGISHSNLKRLRCGDTFSTFGSNNESGTGLGLLLVRDYVAKNGGSLIIESEENHGSEFSFILPKANVNSGSKKAMSQKKS
jgi:signal transduction histidine kinase